MSEIEIRFKVAYDALLEEMPDPPPFEHISATTLRPQTSKPSGRTVLALTVAVIVVIAGAGILLLPPGANVDPVALPATTVNEGAYNTYADSEGNVWIVSDCPNTDQTLSGNPDGLPHVSSVQTREEIEAWYGTGGNSVVVPRNGEAWDRAADGSVIILQVEDFMIEVTLDDASQCPSMPSMNNGVQIIYRIAGD